MSLLRRRMLMAKKPSGGGGEFINLQTQITGGYGEYSQEQSDELFQYLKETYGYGSHSGYINDFKYTFNGFHITYFVLDITDSFQSFIGRLGDDIGEVYFDGEFRYILLY